MALKYWLTSALHAIPIADWMQQQQKYRVFQENGYPVLFCDNFGNSAPILTILSLLQAETYGA